MRVLTPVALEKLFSWNFTDETRSQVPESSFTVNAEIRRTAIVTSDNPPRHAERLIPTSPSPRLVRLAQIVGKINASVGLTLYLLDVQPKPSQHDPDRDERYSQSETAMVALSHGCLPSL